MDTVNLHGKVLAGMARGVENSYIVLICYNQEYSESDFCEIGYLFDILQSKE
jgi:hypothetical protein